MTRVRKWYPVDVKPDVESGLIIRTDMGYVFEAVYENGKFLVSVVRNHKVYFEEDIHQEDIVEWMRYE